METVALNKKWLELTTQVGNQFDNDPDLQSMLFLIGVQELGLGFRKFTKDEKQDLIHVAVCKLLSEEGYYEFKGVDKDNWPHYTPTKKMPHIKIGQQETLLKQLIIKYFEQSEI